jgi:adenylate cyclase
MCRLPKPSGGVIYTGVRPKTLDEATGNSFPFRARVHQVSFGCIVGAGLSVLAGLVFCNNFLGQSLINGSYDLPFSFHTPNPPSDIVIVDMDEVSRRKLQQSWFRPWDRRLHAELLKRLKTDGARTVVFDVLFSQEEHTNQLDQIDSQIQTNIDSANQLLAQAMGTHGAVIVAAHLRKGTQGPVLELPAPVLLHAAAAVGVVEVSEDLDTTVRQMHTRISLPSGSNYTTLDWEAARILRGVTASQPHPPRASSYLNYYGPPGTIPLESYFQALKEDPEGHFSNKVVIVGEFYPVSLPGARIDTFLSPLRISTDPARFSGAEIHATILANLLHSEWLRRLPALVEAGLIVLFGALIGGGLPRLRPLQCIGLAIGACVLLTVLGFELQWRARIWFPWMIPVVIQIPVALTWAILFHAMRSYLASHVLEQSLSLYLSPKQVKNILQSPNLLRPGGVQQRVSILASDIANFSKTSERMDAEDLVKLLNQYYEEAIGCIHKNDGTVVNLVGDAILAVWNAPQAQADHQERAGRAALLLQSRIAQFNQRTDIPPLSTRVGLHTGEACVGNVGSSSHFAYTAIGDAVNLAFRLDGLNKHLDTRILATRDFLKGINDQFDSRMVGLFRFKGFDAVTEVHELIGLAAEPQASLPWRKAFACGLRDFRLREFGAAEQSFTETLKHRPEDGAARFYLEIIPEYRTASLPPEWAGEIELKEK